MGALVCGCQNDARWRPPTIAAQVSGYALFQTRLFLVTWQPLRGRTPQACGWTLVAWNWAGCILSVGRPTFAAVAGAWIARTHVTGADRCGAAVAGERRSGLHGEGAVATFRGESASFRCVAGRDGIERTWGSVSVRSRSRRHTAASTRA